MASGWRTEAGFGHHVDVDGDVPGVGAPGMSVDAIGAGAAHAFRRTGGVWTEESRVTAPIPTASANFGNRVSVSADRIAVAPDKGRYMSLFAGSGGGWHREFRLRLDGDVDVTEVVATGSEVFVSAVRTITVFAEVDGVWERGIKLSDRDVR